MTLLKGLRRGLTFSTLCLGVSLIPYSHAMAIESNALPSGGTVVGGSAGFDYTIPNELHIQQHTDRTVINWDSFNIGQNALTQFHQNSSSSIAVNRVTGAGIDPTQILGTLKANGIVVVLDRNGVIFGQNSVVDVGGIIASTGNIDDQSFLNGDSFLSLKDAAQGEIVLNGQISVSDAGLAAFVAPSVANNGIIRAKLGRVSLAGATSATVDLYGDGLIEVAVNEEAKKTMVSNSGVIEAESGIVMMTAGSAKKIVDSTINMSGVADVSSITQKGGKIILTAPDTKVSGKLDASGKTGGGKILVGGDYQGGGTLDHALTTTLTKDAVLKANATTIGDGGEIIVWSNNQTTIEGANIQANGGALGGNGGLIETSSKNNLNVKSGTIVSASATNGLNGLWLLDPRDVYLLDTAGVDASAGGVFNGSADNQVVDTSTIETALNSGLNVMITTGSTGTQGGDIFVQDGVRKTAGGNATLTLKAARNIVIANDDGDADLAQITSTVGLLNLVLNTDSDGNNDGAFFIHTGTLSTNGGNVTIGGGADPSTGYAYGNAARTTGVLFVNTLLDAAGGNISILGHGYNNAATSGNYGVTIADATTIKTSATGTITINGVGGAGTNSLAGINVSNNSIIQTANGALNITGVSGTASTGGGNHGISLYGGNSILSTGGTITLTGTRSGFDNDIFIQAGSSVIGGGSATGNIIFNADYMDLSSLSIRTTGTATVKPRTANASIGLGGGSGTLNLTDAELSYFTVGTLIIGDAINGTGDITVSSWDLSSKTHNVELYGNDIDIGGLTLGTGDFKAVAKDNGGDLGDLTVSAAITKTLAGNSLFDVSADHHITFNAASNITATNGGLDINLVSDLNYATVSGGDILVTNSTFSSNGGNISLAARGTSAITLGNSTLLAGVTNLTAGGALSYTSPDSITINTVQGSSVLIRTTGAAKNITANGQITTTGNGNAAVIAATGNFFNGRGSDLFNLTGGGRWLVYSTNPAGNLRNGLTPNAAAIYGMTYAGNAPATIAAGNRFLFSDAAGSAPVLTVTADNKSKVSGTANPTLTYNVTGYIDADNAATAYSGAPLLTTAVDGTTPAGSYSNVIAVSTGTLASNLGYSFAFDNGDFDVTAAPPIIVNPPDISGIVNQSANLVTTATKSFSDPQNSLNFKAKMKDGKSDVRSCMVINNVSGGCAVN